MKEDQNFFLTRYVKINHRKKQVVDYNECECEGLIHLMSL